MKIYVSHASGWDFAEHLYAVLKQSALWNEHEFLLPHEDQNSGIPSKEHIRKSELILAEVSYPSTGQGIELGWADSFGKRIVALHKTSVKPSSSLQFIPCVIQAYASPKAFISELEKNLNA